MDDDDDNLMRRGKFENGHWIWDEGNNHLEFVSDLAAEVVEAVVLQNTVPTGAIEFDDDVDLIEQVFPRHATESGPWFSGSSYCQPPHEWFIKSLQIRYRRRYQRKLKPGEANIITLQDVKDIALFTAPFNIISPVLINMLHISTAERFLRALILYCQYYLQVADIMEKRVLEMDSKIRTPICDVIESQYRENLADLRVLLAKEYSIILMGGFDTKKYHHMGPQKKSQSLSNKDARLIQTFLRMSVQIVWLALGRKSFDVIELEVNRLIKSKTFNDVAHNSKSDYISKMSKEERSVLLGDFKSVSSKLDIRSPLLNEVYCTREVDYSMYGFGIVNYPRLASRHRYMMRAVAAPEDTLQRHGVTVGIIGMSRSAFDTMLHPIILTTPTKERLSISIPNIKSKSTAANTVSTMSARRSSITVKKLYNDIVLPENDLDGMEYFPDSFPEDPFEVRHCSETQRRRWQNRLNKLLHPHGNMPPRSKNRAMYNKERNRPQSSRTHCQRAPNSSSKAKVVPSREYGHC